MYRSHFLAVALAAMSGACVAAPIYYVASGSMAADARGISTLTVRAFDDGDAGACTRAQLNSPSRQPTRCARELPDEIAPILRDQRIANAYVVKLTSPEGPGATWRLRFGMSTRDPADVCKNLVDYEKRYASPYVQRYGRITCTVPR
jgi:hypothetical protein